MNMSVSTPALRARKFSGRKTWTKMDVAQLKAAMESRGFDFEEEIDITIQLTLEAFDGGHAFNNGHASSAQTDTRLSRFVDSSDDLNAVCVTTGRTHEQIRNKLREMARKELGISGGSHAMNIREVKEFARRGARTLDDIEDMRGGRTVRSMVHPDVGIKAIGEPGRFMVDVSPYLANVTPKIIVSRDSFCRNG
jgi:hypothetical protein